MQKGIIELSDAAEFAVFYLDKERIRERFFQLVKFSTCSGEIVGRTYYIFIILPRGILFEGVALEERIRW